MKTKFSCFNPRGAGGVNFTPPREFLRYLKNGGAQRRQTFSTFSYINLTRSLKIWAKSVGKFLRNWRFSDVMFAIFASKTAKVQTPLTSSFLKESRRNKKGYT